jgi:glutathione synthase/RimK-type ligase-like ATP-grasp enzyme
VLIVGAPADPHVDVVARGLAARGAEPAVLDFADAPARLELSSFGARGRLRLPDGDRELARVRAVYWRTANPTRASPRLRADLREFAERETRWALESTLMQLSARLVNAPAAVAAHRCKPAQSARVAALGVATPATLVSNCPADIRSFCAEHPGGVVVKPIGGGAHVRRLGEPDLRRDDSMRASPMQYQQHVAGDDLRIYVVGERVFAGRIVSDGRVDFRTDPAHRSEPLALDPREANTCRAIARALDLELAGIDIRRDPSGRWYFLEANPSPMFLRFQADTGHSIADALVDRLLSGAP